MTHLVKDNKPGHFPKNEKNEITGDVIKDEIFLKYLLVWLLFQLLCRVGIVSAITKQRHVVCRRRFQAVAHSLGNLASKGRKTTENKGRRSLAYGFRQDFAPIFSNLMQAKWRESKMRENWLTLRIFHHDSQFSLLHFFPWNERR